MKNVTVESIGDFKKFVDEMEVNVRYSLPKNYRYKWVMLEKETHYSTREISYCWAMENNFQVTGSVGYIFPSAAAANMVADFKTIGGAKRNLVRGYGEYFESVCLGKEHETKIM